MEVIIHSKAQKIPADIDMFTRIENKYTTNYNYNVEKGATLVHVVVPDPTKR